MRKSSLKTKGRGKSENSDAEEESIVSKTEEIEDSPAENGAEASKKRNSRAGKSNESKEEEEEESKEEIQENGKSTNKKRKKDSSEGKSDDEEKEASEDEAEKPRGGKKSKKEVKKKSVAAKEETKEKEEEVEYEVEKIVGHRTVKGKRQFLVRWVGYAEDSDTWENEKDLSCKRSIEEYLAEAKEENGATKKSSPEKKSKSKTSKSKKEKASKKKTTEKNGAAEEEDAEEEGTTKEYEVEKILEVHFKKDKTKEFLIRWKGFKAADDTWEPEENLNCRHLIEKFMEKVDEKKHYDTKELRVNPAHTKRYTLTMHADKRQSRRNANKERITYHEE